MGVVLLKSVLLVSVLLILVLLESSFETSRGLFSKLPEVCFLNFLRFAFETSVVLLFSV